MERSIAFLGLGTMGAPMAANLARRGWEVRAWNRTPTATGVALTKDAGCSIADSIETAVTGADFVFVCAGDVPDVREVLTAASGFARPGAIVVDFSTIGPDAAREFEAMLRAKGLRFLDAPVSGGDIGAQRGTLTIMAGGDPDALDQVTPALEAMGKTIIHCGPSGNGQAVKLCNQVLCAGHMIALTEALLLAERQGIDPGLVVRVCSTGAAGSWALANLGPMIAMGQFQPAFMIRHMLKDLRLALEALGSETPPGTELARRLFEITASLDGGEGAFLGTQAMIRAYREEWEQVRDAD